MCILHPVPFLGPGWSHQPSLCCAEGLPAPAPSSTSLTVPNHRQLGLGAFPVESRWQGVYSPFRDFVRLGCPVELQEALLGFHVQSSRELHKSQEYLCGER